MAIITEHDINHFWVLAVPNTLLRKIEAFARRMRLNSTPQAFA
ncbi:MAG: hypothetical protein ACYDEV_15055 [Acidiferrobacter sp.]